MGSGPDGRKPRAAVKKQIYYCQVDGCSTKLSTCKPYCVRYRVCQHHLSAASVLLKGVESRFCQQCGRFHDLSEFDGNKRSCRTRLAHHNNIRQQRRKEAATAQLLANSVLDLPRSSRPSAARTPGTFDYLVNSPDHTPEYAEYTAPVNRSAAEQQQQQQQQQAAATGQQGSNASQSGASMGSAGDRDSGSAQGGSGQQQAPAARASSQQGFSNSRWTEATAAEFFTRKQPMRVRYEQPQRRVEQPYSTQQQQHLPQEQQQQAYGLTASTAWQAAADSHNPAGGMVVAPHTSLAQPWSHPESARFGLLCVDAADSPTSSLQASDSPGQHKYTQHGPHANGFLQQPGLDGGKSVSTPHSSLAASATTGFAPSNNSSPSTASHGMMHPQQQQLGSLSEGQLLANTSPPAAAGPGCGAPGSQEYRSQQHQHSPVGYAAMLPPEAGGVGGQNTASSSRACLDRADQEFMQDGDALADAVLYAAAGSTTHSGAAAPRSQNSGIQYQQQQMTRDLRQDPGSFTGSGSTYTPAQYAQHHPPSGPGQQVSGLMSPFTPTHYAQEAPDGAGWLEVQQQQLRQQQQALGSFSGSAASMGGARSFSHATGCDMESSSFGMNQRQSRSEFTPPVHHLSRHHSQQHLQGSHPQAWAPSLQHAEAAASARLALEPGSQPCSRVSSTPAATGRHLQDGGFAAAAAGPHPLLREVLHAQQQQQQHMGDPMEITPRPGLVLQHHDLQQPRAGNDPTTLTLGGSVSRPLRHAAAQGAPGHQQHQLQQGYVTNSSMGLSAALHDVRHGYCPSPLGAGAAAAPRFDNSNSSKDDWAAPSPFARTSSDYSRPSPRSFKPVQHPQQVSAEPHLLGPHGGDDITDFHGMPPRAHVSPRHLPPAAGGFYSSSGQHQSAQALTRHLSLPSHHQPCGHGAAAAAVLSSPRGIGPSSTAIHEGSGPLDPVLLASWSSSSLEVSMPALPWAPPVVPALMLPGNVDHHHHLAAPRATGPPGTTPRVLPGTPRRSQGFMQHAGAAGVAQESFGGGADATGPLQLQRWCSEPAGPLGVHEMGEPAGWLEPAELEGTQGGQGMSRHTPAGPGLNDDRLQQGSELGQGRMSGSQGGGPEGRRSSGNVPSWYLSQLSHAAQAVVKVKHQQAARGPEGAAAAAMGPPAPVAVGAGIGAMQPQGGGVMVKAEYTAPRETGQQGLQSPLHSAGSEILSPRETPAGTCQQQHRSGFDAGTYQGAMGAGADDVRVAVGGQAPAGAWLRQLEHSGSSGPGDMPPAPNSEPSLPPCSTQLQMTLAVGATRQGEVPDGALQLGGNRTAVGGCGEPAASVGVDVDGGAAGDDSWAGLEECLLADATDDLMQWAADGADMMDLITNPTGS